MTAGGFIFIVLRDSKAFCVCCFVFLSRQVDDASVLPAVIFYFIIFKNQTRLDFFTRGEPVSFLISIQAVRFESDSVVPPVRSVSYDGASCRAFFFFYVRVQQAQAVDVFGLQIKVLNFHFVFWSLFYLQCR